MDKSETDRRLNLVKRAIDALGGITRIAEQLDVPPSTVYQWNEGIRPMPPLRAIQVEQLTNGKFKAVVLNPKARKFLDVLGRHKANGT